MFIFLLFLLFLAETTTAGLINVNGTVLNATAVDRDGVLRANFGLEPVNSNKSETFYYMQQQLLARYAMEVLSHGNSTNKTALLNLGIGGEEAIPIDINLLAQNAAVDSASEFFKDTVINGQFIGDTGSTFLNRLAQDAVSNGVPLTDVFEVKAGTVRLKAG